MYTTWKERSNQKPLLKEFMDYDINAGIIIGVRGERIQEIERSTGASIRIIRNTKKIIISSSNQENIDDAKARITEIINSHLENNQYNNYEPEQNFGNNFGNNFENNLENNFLDEENFPKLGAN